MIVVPLLAGVANAHQRFTQRLNGWLVRFEVDYISYTKSPYWSLSMYQDGTPMAVGMPLNTGALLLDNQPIKDFGRLVFVGEEATLDNLGIANTLVWIPEE